MSDHGRLMDGTYRWQRHIYDITRKYYLLGRDGLIADLAPPSGGSVLEIGCGTGRNLIAVGKAWPHARLYGVDISQAMLDTAQISVERVGMACRVRLARGDAVDFDPQALFGRATFDRVFISYALSMIPDWEAALQQAALCVAPGGRLEVVDFGQQEGLPGAWRAVLFGWLARFHVTPRPGLAAAVQRLAHSVGGEPSCHSMYRSYAIRGSIAWTEH
ncbi:class I SAM-dependent methyltransferase [Sphingobium xenophagum]|uniref:class I SAM-dependent methyltransferase n=1 Tax=Sphingobium xenophagum TaxID=121428 RepID=UPI00037B2396|nr:class I SAM-dependent methyltransferase [Sphingobium xenophagum]